MHNIKQMTVNNVHAGEYVSNLDAVDDAMDEHAMIMLCSSREAYHRSCTRLCPGGKPGSDRSADAGDHKTTLHSFVRRGQTGRRPDA